MSEYGARVFLIATQFNKVNSTGSYRASLFALQVPLIELLSDWFKWHRDIAIAWFNERLRWFYKRVWIGIRSLLKNNIKIHIDIGTGVIVIAVISQENILFKIHPVQIWHQCI